MSDNVNPTEDDFRKVGYTINAIHYPLTDDEFAMKCKFNGVSVTDAPFAWKFAPNKEMKEYWTDAVRHNDPFWLRTQRNTTCKEK